MRRRSALVGFAGSFCALMLQASPTAAQSGAMTDDEFWALIDLIGGTRWDDSTSDVSALVAALSVLPEGKITAFYDLLGDKALALATREHYSAFSWFPGLSDTFLYARLAVIANGRETYEAILAHPRLFPARASNVWFERLLHVCDDAYRIATGREFERPGAEKFEIMFH